MRPSWIRGRGHQAQTRSRLFAKGSIADLSSAPRSLRLKAAAPNFRTLIPRIPRFRRLITDRIVVLGIVEITGQISLVCHRLSVDAGEADSLRETWTAAKHGFRVCVCIYTNLRTDTEGHTMSTGVSKQRGQATPHRQDLADVTFRVLGTLIRACGGVFRFYLSFRQSALAPTDRRVKNFSYYSGSWPQR